MVDNELLQAISQMMDDKLEPIITEQKAMKETQSRMQDTLTTVQDAQSRMQDTQSRMQDTQSRMQDTQSRMQETLTTVQETQSRMQETQRTMQETQKIMQETLTRVAFVQENTVLPQLKLVYENQTQIIEEHKSIHRMERKIEVLQDEVFAIKETIKELKQA